MITECGDEYTAANQLVAALLGSLPANMTELRSRLASCESSLVRNALLKTIAGGDYSTEESSLLASAFGVPGIGDCKAAVKELLANPVATKYAKCSMMDAIVQAEGSDFLMMILQEFPQKQMLELMGDHFADALERLVASEEEGPDGIVELLESAPASEQQSAFKSIDAIRQQVGVFAADLYAKGVCHKSLEPLHEGMVAAIVEEGGEHGVQLLTQLRDTTRDPARRRSMQKALLRLGTAAAEPQAKVGESQKGAVYVGSCDGQGAYVILGLHQRHKASSSTLVDLCIRASEDIRDGFTAPRQREAALREALETFGSKDSVGFVRIPWAEAARLVVEAVARTKDAGKEVPADARSAVRIFERVAATEGVGLVPVEEGGVDVPAVPSVDAVRRLLDLPLYDYWFFDTGDLRGVGMLPSPGFGSSTSRWVEQACERLNTPAMQRKLVGMAQHMALWHRYNGDAVHAETMEALARATADHMVQSQMLPVMLK
jgi:hypothetical protein